MQTRPKREKGEVHLERVENCEVHGVHDDGAEEHRQPGVMPRRDACIRHADLLVRARDDGPNDYL